MSWIESSCKMSLLLTFSKFLNLSEHCFYKVREKKIVHLTELLVRLNELCVSSMYLLRH